MYLDYISDQTLSKGFLDFVNSTGSPYHTVLALKDLLDGAGFIQIYEHHEWNLIRGTGYYVIRNGTSIAAFYVPIDDIYDSVICVSHTDSPCLKLRPKSKIVSEKYLQLGVSCYGGGLWHTWFDRGLGIAGKVIIRDQSNPEIFETCCFRINDPVCIIPNLAIHLQTSKERAAFEINPELHLVPLMSCDVHREEASQPDEYSPPPCRLTTNDDSVPDVLLKKIASEIQCKPSEICGIDACLMDATPSRLCGIHEDFIESPRLDNNVSCFVSCIALIEHARKYAKENYDDDDKRAEYAKSKLCMIAAFDHEEVGSTSFVGANSNILYRWIRRIKSNIMTPTSTASSLSLAAKQEESLDKMINRSLLVSCDMAHGVHPNYPDKHQKQHKPMMNSGVVLKTNCNQRYATEMTGDLICRIAGHEIFSQNGETKSIIQPFVVRNDSPCGSTVGPYCASLLGIRTIDIGIAQLAMHSCRELCGAKDLLHLKILLRNLFTDNTVFSFEI